MSSFGIIQIIILLSSVEIFSYSFDVELNLSIVKFILNIPIKKWMLFIKILKFNFLPEIGKICIKIYLLSVTSLLLDINRSNSYLLIEF